MPKDSSLFVGWKDNHGTPVFAGEKTSGTFSMPARNVILVAQWATLYWGSSPTANGLLTITPAATGQNYNNTVASTNKGSSSAWTVSSNQTWCSFESTNGINGDYAKLVVDNNPVASTRSATLTFTQTATGLKFIVTVNQAAATVVNYTITYALNGGDTAPSNGTAPTPPGTYLIPSTIPTRSGYTFDYYTASGGGQSGNKNPGNTLTGIIGNVTLTCQWTIIPPTYSVTYDNQGGSATSGSPFTGILSGGTHNVVNTVPTKTNYIFAGWTASGGGQSGVKQIGATLSNITGNVTLTAIWTTPTTWVEPGFSKNASILQLNSYTGSPLNPFPINFKYEFVIGGITMGATVEDFSNYFTSTGGNGSHLSINFKDQHWASGGIVPNGSKIESLWIEIDLESVPYEVDDVSINLGTAMTHISLDGGQSFTVSPTSNGTADVQISGKRIRVRYTFDQSNQDNEMPIGEIVQYRVHDISLIANHL